MNTNELIKDLHSFYWVLSNKSSAITNEKEYKKIRNSCELIIKTIDKLNEQEGIITDLKQYIGDN